jgi:hypothetical protein
MSDFSKALAWFEKLLWVSLPYDYLGASPQAVTRPFADVCTHPGRRFVAHVATGDSGDGGRYDQSCLDHQRIAVLSRLGSFPGSTAGTCAPIPELGCVPLRALRDTTNPSSLHKSFLLEHTNSSSFQDAIRRNPLVSQRVIYFAQILPPCTNPSSL